VLPEPVRVSPADADTGAVGGASVDDVTSDGWSNGGGWLYQRVVTPLCQLLIEQSVLGLADRQPGPPHAEQGDQPARGPGAAAGLAGPILIHQGGSARAGAERGQSVQTLRAMRRIRTRRIASSIAAWRRSGAGGGDSGSCPQYRRLPPIIAPTAGGER